MSDAFATSPMVHALGWALIHSLWQGALTGALTAVVLAACRRSATRRYVAACAGLVAMVTLPAITALTYAGHTPADVTSVGIPAAFAETSSHGSADAVPLPAGSSNEPFRPISTGAAHGSRARLEAWSILVVPVWLGGVLVLSCRFVAGWLVVRRLRRAATRPVEDVWRTRAQTIADRMRLTRTVRLAESALADVPLVIGWLRPMILLPAAVFTGLSPAQLEAVIAHELAHIRRGDYLVNLLQTTGEILLFYHPATWWISHQIRIEREHCCDDIAVALCGDRVTYVRALADLEELRGAHAALALGAAGGSLLPRIRRLLGMPPAVEPPAATSLAAGVALSALALMPSLLAGEAAHRRLESIAGGVARDTPRDHATLMGRIVDARSQVGLAGASIEMTDVSGERSLNTAVSDLQGRYEVRGVSPGEYRVFVRAEAYVEGQYGQRQPEEAGVILDVRPGERLLDIDVGLQLASGVTGRIMSASGEGLPGAEIELLADRFVPGGVSRVAVAFGYSEEAGRFRVGELPPGRYYLRAYPSWPIRPPDPDGRTVYGLTYFPSVSHPAAAQPLVVDAGQVLFDIDFALAAVETRTVSGQLIDAAGQSFEHAEVTLSMHGASSPFSQTAPVSQDGRFQMRNVVPGDYLLSVHDPVRRNRWVGGPVRHLVVEEDLSDVRFVARRSTRLDGRIVGDHGGVLPFDPRVIRLGIEPRDERPAGGAPGISLVGMTSPRLDGTFSLENVGGRSALQVQDVPVGWMLKAIRLDGMDIADQETDFGERSPRLIEIVLTDRVADVTGLVSDASGRPVSTYTVVVFPMNPAHWKGPSRLIRGVRPRRDGSYRVETLPTGDYLAIAMDSLPFNAWDDAEVLARLSLVATGFRLGDAEHRTLNLELAALPAGLQAALEPHRGDHREPRAPEIRPRARLGVTKR